jgi:hypothetical protein
MQVCFLPSFPMPDKPQSPNTDSSGPKVSYNVRDSSSLVKRTWRHVTGAMVKNSGKCCGLISAQLAIKKRFIQGNCAFVMLKPQTPPFGTVNKRMVKTVSRGVPEYVHAYIKSCKRHLRGIVCLLAGINTLLYKRWTHLLACWYVICKSWSVMKCQFYHSSDYVIHVKSFPVMVDTICPYETDNPIVHCKWTISVSMH